MSATIPLLRQAIEPILGTIQDRVHAVWIDTAGNTLTVRFQTTPEDSAGMMLHVVVKDAAQRIGIPNILTQGIGVRGLGRSLIASVRSVAGQGGYRLFIDDMVQGFYRKSLEWGAIEVDHETVEITDATRLADVTPGHSTFKAINARFLTDEQVLAAQERFLAANPSVLAELNAFSPELAKIYHINLEDQRKKLAAEAIATQARRKGIDAFEVWLEHAIESPSERTSILERRQELIRAAIGN